MNINTSQKLITQLQNSGTIVAGQQLPTPVVNAPLDLTQVSGPEIPPDPLRVSSLTAGISQGYSAGSLTNIGKKSQEKNAKDLRSFEERLDPAAREAFRELDPDKQIETMKLGKVFAGNNLGDSSLVKLMQDGRLYEKDSSGMTPLQRLTEAANPDKPDFKSKGNFVTRVLDAIENPTKSSDANRKGGDEAAVNPAEFIRKAGEEYNDDLTFSRTSEWDRSIAEG